MTKQTLGWWGERWLAWIRSLRLGPESEGQYKSAQRAEGSLRLEKGRLTAQVWVSDRRQVQSVLKVKPWSDRDWRRAVEAVAGSPELSQRVLSGTMGPELEAALAALKLFLFPDRATTGCTCGAGEGRCRHLNYLVVQTAEMLDGSPFLWLELMGRSRQELLAELKACLSDREAPRGKRRQPARADAETETEAAHTAEAETALTAPTASEPLEPARFWETPVDPAAIPVRPGGSAAPDGLIRALGPLPVEEGLFLLPAREPLRAEEALRRMVVQVGRTASALALGELEPAYRSALLQGKQASLAARLAQEVEEVVRAEGVMLAIDALHARCPTAAAAGDEATVRKPLAEACALLPPDLITVANRYVGPAAALLRGALFHHVVTLEEYRQGEADDDADWVRALAITGRSRPPLAPWFAPLKPAVGDELCISLPEGEGGVAVSLVRRQRRDLAARLQSDAIAAQLLQALASMTPDGHLPEQAAVGALLAEGGYRGELHPDPIWLLPLLGPGLYLDPPSRSVTRQPNTWRPGLPRFVYGSWPGRDRTLMDHQARLMKRWLDRRSIEIATACISWWGRLWPGAQDQPGAAASLGPFLHFLWNIAPREAVRYRIPPEKVPAAMAEWFAFLEESTPAAAGVFAGHRLACSLLELYEERCATLPPETAGEGALLAWQAEGFRWMGPAHYLSGGSYR